MFAFRPEGDWGAKEGKIFLSEMGSLTSKCIFKNIIPSEYPQPFTELSAATCDQIGQESLLGSVVRNVLPGMTHIVDYSVENAYKPLQNAKDSKKQMLWSSMFLSFH